MTRRGVKKPNSGSFQKGNKVAVGNPGPSKHRPVTETIIQKLNEMSEFAAKHGNAADRKKIWDLVDELFAQAMPTYKTDKNGKLVLVNGKPQRIAPGSLQAIQEIVNRSDGRPVQAFAPDGGGKVTIMFEAGDEKL